VRFGLTDKVLYAGLLTDSGSFSYGDPLRAMRAALKLDMTSDESIDIKNRLAIHLHSGQLKLLFDSKLYKNVVLEDAFGKRYRIAVVLQPATDTFVCRKLLGLVRGFDFSAIIQLGGRASLRAKHGDISKFAAEWEGGGHPFAASALVREEEIDVFVRCFIDYISKMMNAE